MADVRLHTTATPAICGNEHPEATPFTNRK